MIVVEFADFMIQFYRLHSPQIYRKRPEVKRTRRSIATTEDHGVDCTHHATSFERDAT